MNKVLVICGPTGVGKTKISLELAKRLNGEIINGDSMQVYKEMNIGTAKICPEEMEGIPHHLFSIKSVSDNFSVAEFQTILREQIELVSQKNKMPIIVGGTGLYLKAGLYDYVFQESQKKDYHFEDKTNEELYKLLIDLDKDSAEKIHVNNRKRVIRALEVFYETGLGKEKIRSLQEHKPVYDVDFIGLTRERKALYANINQRVETMFEQGLEKEAKEVIKIALPTGTALQAIGYKEFNTYFDGSKTLEEVKEEIKSNTRKFAKRQYTWFNHQLPVVWIDVTDKLVSDVCNEIIAIVKESEKHG